MSEFINKYVRTHSCCALNKFDEGKEVVLMGWVATRRDHGGLIFVDLRDREGMTQIVFNPETDQRLHELAGHLRSEYCLGITGKVHLRPQGMSNPKLKTGDIEIIVNDFEVFNKSKTPPFPIEDAIDTNEDTRLQYRYLDLRRSPLQKNMRIRSEVARVTRDYLFKKGFLEIETPMLTKSTPEGARDYLVPSRVHHGEFFALPQSPQLFKQLLMVSGFDRYYQITKCFRDEDLRADRQPEFTQVDIETSFLTETQITALMEEMIRTVFQETIGVALPNPFPRMTYAEAMARFGSDKPDLRVTLELTEVTDAVKDAAFKVFRSEE